jgi:MerR HTH family regulatory protein
MQKLSTAQVAKKIEVHKVTLIRWLLDGKVTEPRRVKQGGQEVRIWTDRDVERVRKFKAAHYRKGRGRKKGKKSKS